jgi:hypothetical protein
MAGEVEGITPYDAFSASWTSDPAGFGAALAASLTLEPKLEDRERFNILARFLDLQFATKGDPPQIWKNMDTPGRKALMGGVRRMMDVLVPMKQQELAAVMAVSTAAQDPEKIAADEAKVEAEIIEAVPADPLPDTPPKKSAKAKS